MPDDTPPHGDDERDALAGELALGLLTGEERADALRRTLSDRGFAAEVAAWHQRLAPLLDHIIPTTPPGESWDGIVARVGQGVSRAVVRRWRVATAVATAIAAALALTLVLRAPPAPPPQPTGDVMLAQITDAKGEPLASLHYDAGSGELRVRTANLPAGARVPELWVIGADATPRSLGLMRRNASGAYTPPPGTPSRMQDGATIAVTLEPQAKAPHTAPSGTILGTAKLVSMATTA